MRSVFSSTADVDEDLVLFVGGIIFRHITQLICNASAIYQVGPDTGQVSSGGGGLESGMDDNAASDVGCGTFVTSNNQYRVATAIYPSASMMNHSCDPTVINSFFGERLIVRAIKSVEKGGEVYNCYGPHFRCVPVFPRKLFFPTFSNANNLLNRARNCLRVF